MIEELTDALIGICRQFGIAERTVVCGSDVSVAQCVALQFIKGGAQRVSALADYMGVTRGSATKLVDGMVDKGWMVRRRDDEDGRTVLLELTASGDQLAGDLRSRTEAIVGATVGDFGAEETRALLRALQLLEKTLGTCCTMPREEAIDSVQGLTQLKAGFKSGKGSC